MPAPISSQVSPHTSRATPSTEISDATGGDVVTRNSPTPAGFISRPGDPAGAAETGAAASDVTNSPTTATHQYWIFAIAVGLISVLWRAHCGGPGGFRYAYR